MKNKKHSFYFTKLFLLAVGAFWLIILAALSFVTKELNLLEQSDIILGEAYSFDDKDDNGNSKVLEHSLTDSLVLFKFKLAEGFEFPYAGGGVNLYNLDSSACVDLSSYSEFDIQWYGKGLDYARVTLLTFDDERTSLDNPLSFRHIDIHVQVSEISNIYTTTMDQFMMPQWWKEQKDIPVASTERFLDKVCKLEWIISSSKNNLNSGELKIEKITFRGADPRAMIAWGIFGIIVFIAWMIARVFYLKKIKRDEEEERLKKEMDSTLSFISSKDDLPASEWEKLKQYIVDNYRNPDISAEMIAKHFGMNPDRLTSLIKTNTGLTFKPFLNQLRVTKAKNLLIATEEQITFIADTTGFNNTSHFNRVFKSDTGMTPSEFRKQERKK